MDIDILTKEDSVIEFLAMLLPLPELEINAGFDAFCMTADKRRTRRITTV
jgi:hypothetical protein